MQPLGKIPKLLIALALVIAALLFLDLEAVHDSAKRLLLSNSLDFSMISLAAFGSFFVARRSRGYARQLWTLLSVALALAAIAQALATLRGHEWVGDIGRGLTTVTVKVRNPEVTHIVKIQDFENWLNRGCKSPKETALKGRLRQMLGIGER